MLILEWEILKPRNNQTGSFTQEKHTHTQDQWDTVGEHCGLQYIWQQYLVVTTRDHSHVALGMTVFVITGYYSNYSLESHQTL